MLRQEFTPVAARRHLVLKIRPCAETVLSDPMMLRQILQNLLANALRYTQRGSVLMGCRLKGAHVSIKVHDTGPGIPEAQREGIFSWNFSAGKPVLALTRGSASAFRLFTDLLLRSTMRYI